MAYDSSRNGDCERSCCEFGLAAGSDGGSCDTDAVANGSRYVGADVISGCVAVGQEPTVVGNEPKPVCDCEAVERATGADKSAMRRVTRPISWLRFTLLGKFFLCFCVGSCVLKKTFSKKRGKKCGNTRATTCKHRIVQKRQRGFQNGGKKDSSAAPFPRSERPNNETLQHENAGWNENTLNQH